MAVAAAAALAHGSPNHISIISLQKLEVIRKKSNGL